MTFLEIVTQIGQRLNYNTLPAAVQVRLLNFLNIRHRQILTKLPMLRNSNLTLTTTSGQQKYSLPPIASKVLDIYDPNLNDRKLDARTLGWLRGVDARAENTSFGTPSAWVDFGIRAVQADIATPTKVYAVSDDATDNCNVTIQYTRAGGYAGQATAALTNTTPVQLGTATDINEVTKFYLSASALGTVTLTTNAVNGAILSTLAPGQTFARFKSILLWPTPHSNTATLKMDIVRNVPDATVDPNDEPLIPEDFQWILIPGVLQDEYAKIDDARYGTAKTEYTDGLKALESDSISDDLIIIPGGGPKPYQYPYTLPATGTEW